MREVRYFAGGIRAKRGEETIRIEGHSAIFDSWTDLSGFREVVRPGAFADAIREKQDVRCLFNHDPNWILGRTASGTCSIAEDSSGLRFECEVRRTAFAEHVAAAIERGDVSGCSFAFRVRKDGAKWTYKEFPDGGEWERELLSLDLFDVGPVVYPAYPETDVSVASRSLEAEKVRRTVIEAGPSKSSLLRDRHAANREKFAAAAGGPHLVSRKRP